MKKVTKTVETNDLSQIYYQDKSENKIQMCSQHGLSESESLQVRYWYSGTTGSSIDVGNRFAVKLI